MANKKGKIMDKVISFENGNFVIKSPYNASLVSKIKALPTRRWDTKSKTWQVPARKSNAVIALAKLATNEKFEVTADAAIILGQAETMETEPDKVLSIADNLFYFTFPYDPTISNAIKTLDDRKYKKKPEPHWTVPINSSAQSALDIAKEFDFHIEIGVSEIAQQAIETAGLNLEASRADDANIEVAGLGGELRPFQKAGVAYAARAKSTFIADEMGLGKTIEALATIQKTNAYPALIVCPASLKPNWKREAEKWLPGRLVSVINGTKGAIGADVVIVNYDVLGRNKERLMGVGFKAVVLDESHYIKNSKSARSKYAKEIGKQVNIRICLTGTPVVNRPNEMISQLEFLGRLDDLGGFWNFAKRYCNAHRGQFGWDFSGSSNLDELNKKLRQTCYIRRNKADVLPELPDKTISVIPIQIDNRKEYKAVYKEIEDWIKERASQDREFEWSIADLSPDEKTRAVKDRGTSAEEHARTAEKLVLIGKLKQAAARGKLSAIKEWVTNFLETGEKLVLFAHHTEIIDVLADEFKALTITGKTPIAKRQAAVDAFQNDPATRLIILNIKAGGVGLTLTASSNVAFAELDWTPPAHDQASDRCHRIGQKNAVNVWYFIGKNTIDEDIYSLIEEKRQVVDASTEGSETDSSSVFNALWKKFK